MMQLEQLQSEIEALPETEFDRLRRWMAEKDWARWDEQLAEDVESGKLDFLVEEAVAAKKHGKLRDL